MKATQPDLSDIKRDIFRTLAICALLNEGSDEAVAGCAKELAKRAPRSIKKATLFPMMESRIPYDIVMEEIVFPQEEVVIGRVWRAGHEYEYEIVLKWCGGLEFDSQEVVNMTAAQFINRGIFDGRIYMSFKHPFLSKRYDTSTFLPDHARYSATEERCVA